MAIGHGRLKNRPFPDTEQAYGIEDTTLYALGLGQAPLDPRPLRHVYEEGLVALPAMGMVPATPGLWVKEPDAGVDWPDPDPAPSATAAERVRVLAHLGMLARRCQDWSGLRDKGRQKPMTRRSTPSAQRRGPTRRHCLDLLAASPALGLLAARAHAAAQEAAWPTRPVRALVAFPAGSGTDTLARFYAERLSRALGQPVPVENMGGANGAIAARAAARAAPDGYTMFFGTVSTHAANPNLLREPGYDPIRDFAPVSMITINALALLVRADFPARDLRAFIAHARASPGGLNYGIGNAGGLAGTHLLSSMTGIRAEQVTYRGTPAAITDLLGGRLHFMVVDLGPAVEHLRAGTLRALAVTTARRIDILPEVPTMQEAGIPGYDFASWNAVWMPARTPAPIVARLNREIVAIGEGAEARRFAAAMGITSTTGPPEALGAFTERELARWARIVAEAGIPKE